MFSPPGRKPGAHRNRADNGRGTSGAAARGHSCTDDGAHVCRPRRPFCGANGIPRSQDRSRGGIAPSVGSLCGGHARGRKADPRHVPIAAAALGRRSRSTARSLGSPGDCARSDARRAACRCCAPQERAGVGPATPAGGGDLAAGPLAAARSARTTRRRSTKPPARLWNLASAATAAAVNHYRHPWRIC